jgi:hypothetical protein
MNLLVKTAKRYAQIAASLLFSLLFLALNTHAEEAGSASQQSAENLFKWINFALVAGVIVWLCLKKGPAFFGRRADSISSEIQKSTEAKKQAEQQLQDAETELQNLEKWPIYVLPRNANPLRKPSASGISRSRTQKKSMMPEKRKSMPRSVPHGLN